MASPCPFPRGSKWRVIRDGAFLRGSQLIGSKKTRWEIPLELGSIITFDGYYITTEDGQHATHWHLDGNRTGTFSPVESSMQDGRWPASGFLAPAETDITVFGLRQHEDSGDVVTEAQWKLAAIRARLHEVWQHPALLSYGPMSNNLNADLMVIIAS